MCANWLWCLSVYTGNFLPLIWVLIADTSERCNLSCLNDFETVLLSCSFKDIWLSPRKLWVCCVIGSVNEWIPSLKSESLNLLAPSIATSLSLMLEAMLCRLVFGGRTLSTWLLFCSTFKNSSCGDLTSYTILSTTFASLTCGRRILLKCESVSFTTVVSCVSGLNLLYLCSNTSNLLLSSSKLLVVLNKINCLSFAANPSVKSSLKSCLSSFRIV